MHSAGERGKVALEKPIYPTQEIDGVDVVSEGSYKGEVTGLCNGMNGTHRIAGIEYTREEAEAKRADWNLAKGQFHLDAQSRKPGVYCMYYQNEAIVDEALENQHCTDHFGWLDYAHSWIDELPFVPESSCDLEERRLKTFIHGEPSFAEKSIDSLIAGAGFTIAGIGIGSLVSNRVRSKVFEIGGRIISSITNRFPGGGTPPSTGGAGSTSNTSDDTSKPTEAARKMIQHTMPLEWMRQVLNQQTMLQVGGATVAAGAVVAASKTPTFMQLLRFLPQYVGMRGASLAAVPAGALLMTVSGRHAEEQSNPFVPDAI